jgi:hypothetical protein
MSSPQMRHFKALNKKNWINWRRTLAGSITEIACPIALILILMFLRIQIKKEIIDNVNLEKMRHGLYPVSSFDPSKKKGSQYTVNFNEVLETKEQVGKFMVNGGVHTG